MTDRDDDIDDIEALLPWYAAGTLEARDKRRVETALAARADLRASLALIEEDRDETVALNERLGAPGSAALARVLAVAAAEPRKPPIPSRLASFAALIGLGAAPDSRRFTVAAAAALALVVAVEGAAVLSLAPNSGGGSYQTASATKTEGAEALVAFAPDARLDALAAFLSERHAVIVDGPRGGLYRLRFGDKRLSADETAALIASLGKSPLVRMALPATGN